MNNEEIEQAIDGLKLQRFWPHEDDIEHDAIAALKAIEELQARYRMMTTLADVTADNAADRIDELLAENDALKERILALQIVVERMTRKEDWEVVVDLQVHQHRMRKAFKTVIKQLDDAVAEIA